MPAPDISPTEFGVVKERVENLRREVSDLRADLKEDIKSLTDKVDALTSMLDRARGAKWGIGAAISGAGVLGGVVSWFVNVLQRAH